MKRRCSAHRSIRCGLCFGAAMGCTVAAVVIGVLVASTRLTIIEEMDDADVDVAAPPPPSLPPAPAIPPSPPAAPVAPPYTCKPDTNGAGFLEPTHLCKERLLVNCYPDAGCPPPEFMDIFRMESTVVQFAEHSFRQLLFSSLPVTQEELLVRNTPLPAVAPIATPAGNIELTQLQLSMIGLPLARANAVAELRSIPVKLRLDGGDALGVTSHTGDAGGFRVYIAAIAASNFQFSVEVFPGFTQTISGSVNAIANAELDLIGAVRVKDIAIASRPTGFGLVASAHEVTLNGTVVPGSFSITEVKLELDGSMWSNFRQSIETLARGT